MFPKKVIDNRKKNPSRKISSDIAIEVRKRDGFCIICKEREIQEIHHIYYGLYKQLDQGRNGSDRLCGLCNICHHKLHFEGGNDYRAKTIEYIERIIKKV